MALPASGRSILDAGCRNLIDSPMVSRPKPLCLTTTAQSTPTGAIASAYASAVQLPPARLD